MISQNSDTICALATPAGGAIAVIRLSGPQAITIADKIFFSRSGRKLADAKPGTLHYGEIRACEPSTPLASDDSKSIADCSNLKVQSPKSIADSSKFKVQSSKSIADSSKFKVQSSKFSPVDDVVVSVYRAPHSYTGEDSIEISCHGSRYIIGEILRLLQANGARQAEPGEYTRRAYLNGKMDLSQAEAVADLIAASGKAAHDLAIGQLKGHVRTALNDLRERLQRLTALLELELDFSDHEDLQFADRSELLSLANDIKTRLMRLADTYQAGRAIKEGIPVAIVGKPNVGKSTLLNRLVGEDRAIVSDMPGTTRDSIEDTVDIDGLQFRFIDTAGLRHTDDRIEQMGIDRAYQAISRATIILWLIDSLPTDDELSDMKKHAQGKKLIIARNKCDLQIPTPTPTSTLHSSLLTPYSSLHPLPISAKTSEGIDLLKQTLVESSAIPDLTSADAVVSSARQYTLLQDALTTLQRVIDGLQSGLSSDLIAEDLRLVINYLSDVTGIDRITPATTLNLIFSEFCIGK